MTEELKIKKATYHLYTFLISKMVGSLGANVYAFGMAMYILSMTGSAFSFAANMIFSLVPRMIVSPFAGAIGDRVPRKYLVIGGQIGEILTIGGLLVYSLIFGISVPAIYCTTLFYSVFATFSGIAFTASISNLVDTERLQKAMSFNQLSYSVAGIGGPIIGGLLFGFVSMPIFLILNIIALAITTALEATMNFNLYKKEVTEQKQSEKITESLREGWRYIRKKPIVKSVLLAALWVNLFFCCINVGASFILLEVLKMQPHHIGYIEAGGAIGMLITSIYFASRSNVKNPLLFSKRSVLGMAVLMMAFAIPLLLSLTYLQILIFYMVAMAAFASLGVLTNTPIGLILQISVDEEYRGRVIGILEMTGMGMMPLGTIVYGLLFDLVPATYLLIGSGLILIIVINLCISKKALNEAAQPEEKIEELDEKFA